MTTLELITLGLAIWGSILSSVLGVFKLLEYRISLKIYLEWQAFYERCHLVIVNKGRRPIVIKKIIVESPEDRWAGFTVLDNEEEDKNLPAKLGFGDEITLQLSHEVENAVWNQQFYIYIYDSEGNRYMPTLRRTYSPRYEGYSRFEKLKKVKTQNR